MKNVLRKLNLTDSDLEPNIIPQWKDDPSYLKWKAKAAEISQQLRSAESEQQMIQEEIEQGQAAVVQARSAVILEEGSQEQLATAESHLANLLQKDTTLTLETKALAAAQTRAERETQEAEQVAREKVKAIVLPLYQERVRATLEHLEAAMEANEETKTFEKLVGQSGLNLHHGSFGSPYVINGINFPLGLKEYRQNVEGLLSKSKL